MYADGSYVSSTDRGGYGIVIQNGLHIKKCSGFVVGTTSNRMELIAVITALKYLKIDGRAKARVFSDSKYVVNAVSLGWIEVWAHSGWKRAKGKELKNVDLWKDLYPLYLYHEVEFYWIAGHENKIHNICHELAYEAAKEG